MNKIIPKTDLAYAAGYIDGDGCFYIGKERSKKRLKQKYVTSMVISSVNTDVLYWFNNLFGGSVHLANKEHGNQKELYQYSLRKRCITVMAQSILPYLVEKKEECLMAIRSCNVIDISEQEAIINKIKNLKITGNLICKDNVEEFGKLRNTIMPTTEDFAYIAGFIDAECCFGIQKYKPANKPNHVYKITLQCNNTKAPAFKWLMQRFGGSLAFYDRRNCEKAKKNQLVWRLSGRALSKIIDKIHPFLKHKKPVCEELMKFYTTTLTNGGARHTEIFRNHYAEVIKTREAIVTKVHLLNLKGIKNS